MNPLGVPIGFAGGTGLNSIAEVRAEAKFAVEAGFDSFWVSQIFGVDPIVALAAVADECGSLAEVGTSVVPIYGRHPLALAAQARTAQDVLGGRFTLGIGPSHAVVVEGFFGESYDRPFTYTREFIDALAPLLRGEPASLDGVEVTAHGALSIEAEPVPILLAAMGPKMLELAGAQTAGTSLGGAVGPKTIASHISPIINKAAADAGRPAPRIKAFPVFAITDEPEVARAAAIEGGVGYASLPAYRAMLDREGLENGGELALFGSIDEVVEGFQRYIDAGATELRIAIAAHDDATEQRSRQAIADWIAS